jgi:hypothetical protein
MRNRNHHHRRATTLIELILVLALLAAVMALAAPSLSRFMAGRTITEEARRFVGLTRYARSHAISTAVPMEVRIDQETGTYALSPVAGYQFEEKKPVEFHLADGLRFDLDPASLDEKDEARILVWPDGRIDEESLETLHLSDERKGDAIEIGRTENGLGYEIRDKG